MADQVARDLGKKAAADAMDAMKRGFALTDEPQQCLVIALYTTMSALGALAGTIKAIKDCTDDEAAAAAVNLIDPREIAASIESRH